MTDNLDSVRAMCKKPTKAFLDELLDRARFFGWTGDYYEVIVFVKAQFEDAGIPFPEEYEPYD